MHRAFSLYPLLSVLAVPLALLPLDLRAQARQPDLFTISDPSPDIPFGTAATGQRGSAGRVLSLAIAPDGQTLYAAAEISGVWKSTDAARHWTHASNGLRSGWTAGHASLALDATNPKRLLYATGDDDGRGQRDGPYGPYGGLWVSDDSAASWNQVALCTGDTKIQSVIFASGRPFVATHCGLFTTAEPNLATAHWTELSTWPDHTGIHEMADGGNQTLFTCSGNIVNRIGNITLANPVQQQPIALAGDCVTLAPAPLAGSGAAELVVAGFEQGFYQGTKQKFHLNVAVLDFQTNQQSTLVPHDPLTIGGSGAPQVRTQHILSAPLTATAAGVAYDVYVADGCEWWAYQTSTRVNPNGEWKAVAPKGECDSLIHVDSWDMAFASTYDPPNGVCAAFASTDGGVYASTGTGKVSSGGCVSDWVLAQSGLHALSSIVMAGLPSTPSARAGYLYLPTGDNDVWVRLAGEGTWISTDYLGDAGQVLVDPVFPASAELGRNGQYRLATGQVTPATPRPVNIAPNPMNAPCQSASNDCTYPKVWGAPGNGGIAAVMTLPGAADAVVPGDYIAIAQLDAAKPEGTAMIVRCRGSDCIDPVQWRDLSPSSHLPQGAVKVLAAGGHTHPVIYVLTPGGANPDKPPGKLLRGTFIPGVTSIDQDHRLGPAGIRFSGWVLANGTGSASLINPITFFVNPYDSSELYAVDQGSVKASFDSGNTWKTEETLTRFATNSQTGTGNAYRFDCNAPNDEVPYLPYLFGCALSWMAFDPFNLNVRIATSEFGGLAFSRDSGRDWMALNVTDNVFLPNGRLTQAVNSAFYDGGYTENDGRRFVPVNGPTIYAALHGSSMISVAGPFPTLEQITMTVPSLPATSVKVVIGTTPNITLQLEKDPNDGSYAGTLLFDYSKYPQLSFKFEVDGAERQQVTKPLTESEKSTGLARVDCTLCSSSR